MNTYNQNIPEEARMRVRQDSWQFVACLNVLHDVNGAKQKNRILPRYTWNNSGNNEKSITNEREVNCCFFDNPQNELSRYRNNKTKEDNSCDMEEYSNDGYETLKLKNINSSISRSHEEISVIDESPLDNGLCVNNNESKVLSEANLNKEKNVFDSTSAPFQSYSDVDSEMTKNFSTTMENVKMSDFEINNIYSAQSEKLEKTKFEMKFSFVVDSKNMYCVTCGKMFANTPRGHCEHYCNDQHIKKVEKMQDDHDIKKIVSGLISELDLAGQYMKILSESVVCCLACAREMDNEDHSLVRHIRDKFHKETREKMCERVEQNFLRIKSLVECDWYKIERYRCSDCAIDFENEEDFFHHLESSVEHSNLIRNTKNHKNPHFYEFCGSCSLLSYSGHSTPTKHDSTRNHKMLSAKENYSFRNLPKLAESILSNAESCVDDLIACRRTLIKDVQNAVNVNYPIVRARTFRSTTSGLNSLENDMDIFLDCRAMWHGRPPTEDQILYFMNSVNENLRKDAETWEFEDIFVRFHSCQFLVIQTRHRTTGLTCAIYYDSDHDIDNTELIKSYNYIFPLHRKLMIFVKKWLGACNLAGSNRISNYALYWQVIFYLQMESIVPSVAELIMIRENNSNPITGWDIGASFTRIETEFTIEELLNGFFAFYANFDYRNDVACPLLGEILKKRDFANPHEQEGFRENSIMRVENPFDLRHNLTKNLRKADVNRFRMYCSESMTVLRKN